MSSQFGPNLRPGFCQKSYPPGLLTPWKWDWKKWMSHWRTSCPAHLLIYVFRELVPFFWNACAFADHAGFGAEVWIFGLRSGSAFTCCSTKRMSRIRPSQLCDCGAISFRKASGKRSSVSFPCRSTGHQKTSHPSPEKPRSERSRGRSPRACKDEDAWVDQGFGMRIDVQI